LDNGVRAKTRKTGHNRKQNEQHSYSCRPEEAMASTSTEILTAPGLAGPTFFPWTMSGQWPIQHDKGTIYNHGNQAIMHNQGNQGIMYNQGTMRNQGEVLGPRLSTSGGLRQVIDHSGAPNPAGLNQTEDTTTWVYDTTYAPMYNANMSDMYDLGSWANMQNNQNNQNDQNMPPQ
jgi:hypothetical protein